MPDSTALERFVADAPAPPARLQGFQVRLRHADGSEQTRIVRAVDVVEASRLAAGQLAIDAPDAEIVSVAWLGEALG